MSPKGNPENDLVKHYLDWKNVAYSEYHDPEEMKKLHSVTGMDDSTPILMKLPDTYLVGFYSIVEGV